MHKISPTLNACKQFKQNANKTNKTNNNNNKKVKFDSARVAFQVEYDIPDDRTLRVQIPIWTEHWKKSKSSLALQLMRSVSCRQWIKIFMFFVSFSALLLQLYQTIDRYLDLETVVAADYRLPNYFHFPSISLCIPIVVPFVQKCVHRNNESNISCENVQTIRQIFNQSLSQIGHRCKYTEIISSASRSEAQRRDSSGSGTGSGSGSGNEVMRFHSCDSLAPSLQWIHRNRKCFTYFSELTENSAKLTEKSFETEFARQIGITLLIANSNPSSTAHSGDSIPQLFVHNPNAIPFDDWSEFVSIETNRNYKIKYFSTKVQFLKSHRKSKCDLYEQTVKPIVRTLSTRHHQMEALPLSQSDCFSRCLMKEMREQCITTTTTGGATYCLSRFAPIRHDLTDLWEKFCTIRDNNQNNNNNNNRNDCNSEQFYLESIDRKCRRNCAEDCSQQTFHLSQSEQLSNDLSEANVTLTRQLSPDLTLTHVPQTTCLALIAQLGGLAAFWLLFLWLLLRFLKLIQYFWELIEIYYL